VLVVGVVGGLLATVIISATSIALYAHFVTPPPYWSDMSAKLLSERAGPTAAVPDKPQGLSRSSISLRRALEIAIQQVPGEVLKVELEREEGRAVYEIKILAQNGRVRKVSLDARDGDVVEIEDD